MTVENPSANELITQSLLSPKSTNALHCSQIAGFHRYNYVYILTHQHSPMNHE